MNVRTLGAGLFRADGQTADRRDECNNPFSQFYERA